MAATATTSIPPRPSDEAPRDAQPRDQEHAEHDDRGEHERRNEERVAGLHAGGHQPEQEEVRPALVAQRRREREDERQDQRLPDDRPLRPVGEDLDEERPGGECPGEDGEPRPGPREHAHRGEDPERRHGEDRDEERRERVGRVQAEQLVGGRLDRVEPDLLVARGDAAPVVQREVGEHARRVRRSCGSTAAGRRGSRPCSPRSRRRRSRRRGRRCPPSPAASSARLARSRATRRSAPCPCRRAAGCPARRAGCARTARRAADTTTSGTRPIHASLSPGTRQRPVVRTHMPSARP